MTKISSHSRAFVHNGVLSEAAFLVNQALDLNRFYYTESSSFRPVRSHSVAPKKLPLVSQASQI